MGVERQVSLNSSRIFGVNRTLFPILMGTSRRSFIHFSTVDLATPRYSAASCLRSGVSGCSVAKSICKKFPSESVTLMIVISLPLDRSDRRYSGLWNQIYNLLNPINTRGPRLLKQLVFHKLSEYSQKCTVAAIPCVPEFSSQRDLLGRPVARSGNSVGNTSSRGTFLVIPALNPENI